ncbi:MAG: hypothetical protein WCY97_06410 [Methanothrix sp.]|jgi:hypothetical protein|uniref:Uncharacterized protein n=1 Tax=Methanothrix harundinacea TaxID=301375 RepID=A0A117MC09_9EURY|nr:MAG: hypothetical protein APR56_09220 [Methanosaeta sp. SDB]KUK95754.1 MAG: Uncharacterized protein XE07_1604 [Methanothrix harundinacea]MDD2638815.1 hypothetical protein [Methanothrix sp.]MDI9400225.1 hypothetical protein [Euryarchaeota archaeon]MCP1392769.1 hypothetical protein [Methanothrix harundinacea]
MFEIDGQKGDEAGRSTKRGAFTKVATKSRSLVTVFLLFTMILLSSAQIEYEPGERMAERLFELGLGDPWIISEKHPELYDQEDTTWPTTSEFSQYSEYFSMTSFGGPEVERYSASGVPEIRIVGPDGGPSAESAYQPYYAGGEGLWILGTRSWTGYAIVPIGAYLRLLAHTPGGGWADLYTITPNSRLVQRSYSLYPGYSQLTFHAEEAGRYVILFSVDDRMSNAVIVDVRRGTWPASPPISHPPSYGSARVTLRSSGLKGYSVYVDGSYVGTDGRGGDLRDGIFTTTVSGNQHHTIKVYGSGLTCTSKEFYESGRSYTIDVCST